ncbi:MAG: hypothetical protein CME24_00700 [Gemmatimonadetes bacterium]|nr:hypothetical protein [Gemmatimonadota bacterium]
MTSWRPALNAILLGTLLTSAVSAQDRPLVSGGITDKPFIHATGGGTRIGGYMETHFRWEREAGFSEELTFEAKRFNLFTYAPISDRLRMVAELEFEEGGEEIVIEAALMDFELHPAATFRMGILLAPLGRFNLAHDSPANELTDRPLMSTDLIGTALSEVGMGFHGAFYPTKDARVSYEIYAVNGYDDGVLLGDADGTRIPAGKANQEDNNRRPSWVGRIGASPTPTTEIGLSLHTGPINDWEIEGLKVDERQDLTIWLIDAQGSWFGFNAEAEFAGASIDAPSTQPLLASSQSGYYAQLSRPFGSGLISAIPTSSFTAVARLGNVDFDTDTDGDHQT